MSIDWLAGLLEGEGYFVIKSFLKGDKTYRYANVGVQMTDLDVLEKVHDFTGVGHVRPVKNGEGHLGIKQVYQWYVSKHQDALDLMKTVRPLMGERRGERIDAILREMEG